MRELADLYQRVVIEHNRNPRYFHALEPCSHRAREFNPLCGDEVLLYLRVERNRIREAAFQGESCAVATASASLMVEALRGLGVAEAWQLLRQVDALITGNTAVGGAAAGDLAVLGQVGRFPGRDKCARLPWHALRSALRGEVPLAVSTERGPG